MTTTEQLVAVLDAACPPGGMAGGFTGGASARVPTGQVLGG
jgi:hypothetical protein